MWSMKQPAKPNIFGTAPERMKRQSPACGAFQESVPETRSRCAETSITSFVCTKPSFTGTASVATSQ